MRAIIQTKSGSPGVLKLREIVKPVPQDHQVLVKVHASTVTRGDVILRKLHPLLYLPMRLFGIKRKRIPGHEFAGEIVEIGEGITKFKVGEKVFGTTTGLSVGANAEFVCLPENWRSGVLTFMPANATFEEAAAIPVGGMAALEILKRGNIKPNQKVLVYGASGSVGTYAVQLAKNYFAAEVTGVCSTKNIDLVKDLGATTVIDYTESDFTQSDQTYDIVFDAVGKISPADTKSILNKKGTFLSVRSMTSETEESLLLLVNLFEEGKIKAVIDSRFSLAQIVEAHKRVETGHKTGNVVITLIHEEME